MTTTPTPRPTYRGWNVPSTSTLRKYGLDQETWEAYIDEQDGVCAVCRKVPSTGRGVIDHEHVRGWKAMAPELRAMYVRGVLCWFCNHAYLGRGINLAKAYGVVEYLENYEPRRPR